jgi:hypothetical protein
MGGRNVSVLNLLVAVLALGVDAGRQGDHRQLRLTVGSVAP